MNQPVLATRLAAWLAALAPAATLDAQALPTLRAEFRAGAADGELPGLAAVCRDWLPGRPEWPRGLAVGAPFAVATDGVTWQITATSGTLPADAVMAGSLDWPDGRQAVFACRADGVEDWFLPAGGAWPADWLALASDLRLPFDQPRTIDLAVLAGHLAGPLVHDDPRYALLRSLAACGDLTLCTWRDGERLRVRGRSAGGLWLPALLTCQLHPQAPHRRPLAWRAFAALDGERGQAVREFALASSAAPDPLVGLLHADDETRLLAIDALVRRRATGALPRMIAAAGDDLPLATLAATDAVRALWYGATPDERQAARGALLRAPTELRTLDPDRGAPWFARLPEDTDATGDRRARWLLLLLLSGLGIYGGWLRSRLRGHGGLAEPLPGLR